MLLWTVGEMSATEFAQAMEELERYKYQQDTVEERPSIPSLVLVTDQMDQPEREHIPPEVILTEEDLDEEGERQGARLRGEFFRTGEETATFTVRKRRKMSPVVKSMMGEAHVRFARGDLSGAEAICLEVIKEREFQSSSWEYYCDLKINILHSP